MSKISPICFKPPPPPSPIILTTETAFFWKPYTMLTSPTLLKVASREKILSKKGFKLRKCKTGTFIKQNRKILKLQIRLNLLFDHSRLSPMVNDNLFSKKYPFNWHRRRFIAVSSIKKRILKCMYIQYVPIYVHMYIPSTFDFTTYVWQRQIRKG